MHEVYTKAEMPYKGWNNQRVWIEVSEGYRLPAPNNCPTLVYAVMKSCWETERTDRPNFDVLEKQLASIAVTDDDGCK
jgi:hypothetical protein